MKKTCCVLRLASISLMVLLPLRYAEGEIYQCDGKWTNKPCAGAIERTMHEKNQFVVDSEEVEPPTEAAEQKESDKALEPLAPRYALARKLKKFNKDFSRKNGISLSKEEIKAFEDRCINRAIPINQCQTEHDALVQKLNAQLAQKKK